MHKNHKSKTLINFTVTKIHSFILGFFFLFCIKTRKKQTSNVKFEVLKKFMMWYGNSHWRLLFLRMVFDNNYIHKFIYKDTYVNTYRRSLYVILQLCYQSDFFFCCICRFAVANVLFYMFDVLIWRVLTHKRL